MPETNPSQTETGANLNETIERLWGILKRGRWWIVGAASCIPIAAVAVALRMPNQYVSQATLLVVQQISQRYIDSDNNAATLPIAVQTLKLQVLSSARLIRIINDLGLYGGAGEQLPSPLVERMRGEVQIDPIEITPGRTSFDAFTVSFTASTPQLAQEATSRLASLFIEQSQKNQGEKAANTTKFVSDQLDAARVRLTAQEQRLQAFRLKNLGELPDQQQANLIAMTDARARLGTVEASLAHARQEKTSLESSLTDRLVRLQSERADLLTHYTERYPEVIKKDRDIAKVQAVLDRVRSGVASHTKSENGESPDDPALAGIIRQAEVNTAEIESLSKQQEKLSADSEAYQARLSQAPAKEQQLSEILQDYELYKQDYANLEKQKLQSQMTSNLEENQRGQQYRLVDPATLPLMSAGTKRLKVSLGGLGAGIALGLVLAFLMDMRKNSFYTEADLASSIPLPLVLAVPLVRTPGERRTRGVRIAFEWLAGCLMMLTMFAAEFYVFRKG